MFYFCRALLYSPFSDIAMTHYTEWSWCRWKVSFKKFEHSGYGVVCTSPSRVTSSWVSMTEAAVSLRSSISCSRVQRSVRRNVKGMSCLTLSRWRHLFESIPCHWVLGRKNFRRPWIDLRTSLIIKSSVKPKKVTSFTGNLSVSDRGTGY